MPLKEYDAIQLRDEIKGTLGNTQAIKTADRKRTSSRDEVAQYIQEEVVDKDRWPMNMTDLAEETEYSRQLVSEVVQDYFVGVDETEDREPMPTNQDNPMTASPDFSQQPATIPDGEGSQIYVMVNGQYQQMQIDVPDDVEHQNEYIRGYLDGLQSSTTQ